METGKIHFRLFLAFIFLTLIFFKIQCILFIANSVPIEEIKDKKNPEVRSQNSE